MRLMALSGGIILALASLAGFASSLIFSVSLEKRTYGEIVSIFSLISILAIALPIGTNTYYITKLNEYKKISNSLTATPLLLALPISLLIFLKNPDPKNFSLALLLLVSTLSIQGILSGQAYQNEIKAAAYQSSQSLLKFISSLAVAIAFALNLSQERIVDAFAYSLTAGCIIAIPLAIKNLLTKNGGKLFSLKFISTLDAKQKKELLSFWGTSILGVSYSLGMIPLVAYFHGYEISAYLGIYFILWSGGNIIITATINNHYWPKYCFRRAHNEDDKETLKKSLKFSMAISLATLIGTILFALVASNKLWSDFPAIESFILISAFSLSIRPLSAWLSMMILSFDGLITRKLWAQITTILAMLLSVAFLDINTPKDLATLLVILESTYFIGYLISGFKPALKNAI